MFRQTRVDIVTVGQDDVLYQPVSIAAYQGRDYAGASELDYRVQLLKVIQDSLAAQGTQLLVVLAPGKARILPGQLPSQYAGLPRTTSNYDGVLQAARRYQLNVLDAAALMQRWQDTTRFPLFPRGGTHWSGYATALVADTLFRRVEHLTRLDLPDFATHGYTVATSIDSMRYTDDDLQKILNRMWSTPPYPMAYPRVRFSPDTARKQRANALIIGDSFAQSFYNFYPYFQKLFTPASRYWAGYEYVFWPESAPESHTVRDLNLREQLAGRHMVLLICTEQNFGQLGFGFTYQAYRLFRPFTPADEAAISELAKELEKQASWEEIANDPDFARHVREKATSLYERKHI
nr:hypothetical protein [Hymenobacter translucens]